MHPHQRQTGRRKGQRNKLVTRPILPPQGPAGGGGTADFSELGNGQGDESLHGSGATDSEELRTQLRALSARLLEAREMECASISRRVHDELGQALTALQWDVAWLTSRLSPTTRNDEVTEKLDAMSESIATALHTVRKVACELRPPMLDQFGLLAAINWQAGEFQTRFGIPCEVAADGEPVVANRETATGVFRIFQEILTNIARHARATHVGVRLAEESGRVTLVVQDNGCGIATGRQTASLGILGMHERASLLGGTLEIHTSVGSGTTVIVRIPLQKGDGESGAPLTENQRGFV